MSQEILSLNNGEITLVSYAKGTGDRKLQLTGKDGFVQLDLFEVKHLLIALRIWSRNQPDGE